MQRSNLPMDWNELKWIAAQAFRSDPGRYQQWRRHEMGGDWEPTPIESIATGSPLIDYVRQHLPHNLKSTRFANVLPENTPEWVGNIKLGGYSPERMHLFEYARENDPDLRAHTLHKDYTPELDDPTAEVSIGDSGRRKAAQALGVGMGDLIGVQGLQHLWWLLNAAEAVTSVGTLQAIHNAQKGISPIETPLLRTRPMRFAAVAPAWIGMKAASGVLGRQAGYSESVPMEGDPTKSADPILEAASDLFLGRTGKLLPYKDFVKERPDVSKGEYEAYKAYLHGNKSPLKATLDGIHGAEVNFLGKSLPVATAIIPAVAMAMGARVGARRAARRLTENGTDPVTGEIGVDLLKRRQQAQEDLKSLQWEAKNAGSGEEGRRSQADVEAELADVARFNDQYNRAVESETLKNVLLYGGGSLATASTIGATLENVRRMLKGKPPVELDESAPEEVAL
jgi:hypothetical protein